MTVWFHRDSEAINQIQETRAIKCKDKFLAFEPHLNSAVVELTYIPDTLHQTVLRQLMELVYICDCEQLR